MRTIRTFKQFLQYGPPEHLCKSHIYVEDLSGNQKRIKIKELQKLLTNFDYWYSKSSDSRVYRKGKEQEDAIDKLVGEIGKDGLKLYRKYISTKESKEPTGTEKYMGNLFPEMRNVEPQDNSIPLGETGTSHLHDGNLFSGFQFFPRTPKLKSTEEKSWERNRIYGKSYNGE
jgi:hypothetical protein